MNAELHIRNTSEKISSIQAQLETARERVDAALQRINMFHANGIQVSQLGLEELAEESARVEILDRALWSINEASDKEQGLVAVAFEMVREYNPRCANKMETMAFNLGQQILFGGTVSSLV